MVAYVADEHVRLVASFPSLRSVSLVRCVNLYRCKSISESGFACLSSLTSLQELNVDNTAIDDEGLAGLSRSLIALIKLGLYECLSISESGFACLSSLTSLQELDVGFTAIIDEGLAELRRSSPALTIHHWRFGWSHEGLVGIGFTKVAIASSQVLSEEVVEAKVVVREH